MKKQIPAIFLFVLAIVANAAAQYSPVIPVGTELQVRVNENLTSETAQPGDQFTASLVNSIEDENGKIIFGRGAYISGRVISAKPSGRLSDSGELVLSINNIRSGSQSANVTVGPYTVKGDSFVSFKPLISSNCRLDCISVSIFQSLIFLSSSATLRFRAFESMSSSVSSLLADIDCEPL